MLFRSAQNEFEFKANSADFWNCNLCANDTSYFQPVVKNDFLYFNFNFSDFFSADRSSPTKGWRDSLNPLDADHIISIELLDYDLNSIEDMAENLGEYNYGYDSTTKRNHQTIKVDTSLTAFDNLSCFLFKFRFKKPSGVFEIFFTEPYTFVQCSSTVQIKGKYTELDTQGNLYRLPSTYTGDNVVYEDNYRVQGEIYTNEYQVQRERNDNNEVLSSELITIDKLKTLKLPPYMSEKIANSLNAPLATIDGIDYDIQASINKNIPNSNMWYYDVDLRKDPLNTTNKVTSNIKFNCN